MARKKRRKPSESQQRSAASRRIEFKQCPYFADAYCVRSDPVSNLRWRLTWWEAAKRDKGLQRDFRQAAFEDVLFWFHAFCWCFEPRSSNKVRPFVTWPHQNPAILAMDDAITRSESTGEAIDLICNKSRGQGATWMYLLVFLRRWLRDPMFSAGLVTRTESLVDSARDPDTLMWKLDWMILKLPFWMLPRDFDLSRNRRYEDHSLINPENGSTIIGYAATGDVARGGRKTVFAMDELASFRPGEDYRALDSTQHVTNCRFLVSTFHGDSGAYYEAAMDQDSGVHVVLDWRDNPTQNHKLYEVRNRRVRVLRKEDGEFGPYELGVLKQQHARLRKRGYKVEGKPRSIWYNDQCLRPGATPRGIAQELDRDPHGSVAKIFGADLIHELRERECVQPVFEGSLVYDPETCQVMAPYVSPAEHGDLKLWCQVGLNGAVPPGSYVLGCDIAAGTGGSHSSNSVACVINRMTGEQVAEWASNHVTPTRFAKLCVALCRWFYGALLVPEANFGSAFLKTVIDLLGYPNLYYRETEIEGIHEKTQKPGFWVKNDDHKLRVFESLQVAMSDGAFKPRSAQLLAECGEYQWKNGRIIHVSSSRSDDDSDKGQAHGDRVIAAAMAWVGCEDEPYMDTGDISEISIPPGSMAERLRDYDIRSNLAGRDPWFDEDIDIFHSPKVTYVVDEWG